MDAPGEKEEPQGGEDAPSANSIRGVSSEFCLVRALTLTLNQRGCVLSSPKPSSYPQLGSCRHLLSIYLDLFY